MKTTQCKECLAYYTGKHQCDGLMKKLVKNYNKRNKGMAKIVEIK